jgi:hypothetical protein
LDAKALARSRLIDQRRKVQGHAQGGLKVTLTRWPANRRTAPRQGQTAPPSLAASGKLEK